MTFEENDISSLPSSGRKINRQETKELGEPSQGD
jgi:hypothetical protein